MSINQDKELKEAILNLPLKEKDRLLLKLLSKNPVLSNQLRYQLLECGNLDLRRESVMKAIDDAFAYTLNTMVQWPGHLTPGQLMMELRYMSGFVNEHILITKDVPGEVDLRLHILERLFTLDLKILIIFDKYNQKLLAYIASRTKYILDKFSKLHEDYQFDLRERINMLLILIKQSAVKIFAEELMLPQSV